MLSYFNGEGMENDTKEIKICLECAHDNDCNMRLILENLNHNIIKCNDYEKK